MNDKEIITLVIKEFNGDETLKEVIENKPKTLRAIALAREDERQKTAQEIFKHIDWWINSDNIDLKLVDIKQKFLNSPEHLESMETHKGETVKQEVHAVPTDISISPLDTQTLQSKIIEWANKWGYKGVAHECIDELKDILKEEKLK